MAGAAGSRLKHTLPDLPYNYNALEPVISKEIMELHHSKHHATYVNNFNAAEEKLAEALKKSMCIVIAFPLHAMGYLLSSQGKHQHGMAAWHVQCLPYCPDCQAR